MPQTFGMTKRKKRLFNPLKQMALAAFHAMFGLKKEAVGRKLSDFFLPQVIYTNSCLGSLPYVR